MPFNYNEQLHVPPDAHPSCPVWKKGLPVSILHVQKQQMRFWTSLRQLNFVMPLPFALYSITTGSIS